MNNKATVAIATVVGVAAIAAFYIAFRPLNRCKHCDKPRSPLSEWCPYCGKE